MLQQVTFELSLVEDINMSASVEHPKCRMDDISIPSTWEDTSWHNDACPSFQFRNLRIYVDYFDLSDRECESEFRFSVQLMSEEMEWLQCLLDSNDWNEVLKYVEEFYPFD